MRTPEPPRNAAIETNAHKGDLGAVNSAVPSAPQQHQPTDHNPDHQANSTHHPAAPADPGPGQPAHAWPSPLPRRARVLVLAVAALAPVVWALLAIAPAPSDGTVVYASSSLDRTEHWDAEEGVIVRNIYGGGALADLWHRTHERGQTLRVTAVDDIPIAGWATALDQSTTAAGPARLGDTRRYTVTVDGSPARVVLVTLKRYPMLSAVIHNPGAIVLWLGLISAGGFVFWRRSTDPAAHALLILGFCVPIGMTAWPLALQVVDLTGGRGPWAYVVAEIANCLAWGSVLLFALAFPHPVRAFVRRPVLTVIPFLVPFSLYLIYALTWTPIRSRDPFERTEMLLLVSAPSALVILPLVVGVLLWRSRQPMQREHQLALRIVLVSVLLCAVVYLLLGQLPSLAGGTPGVALQLMPFALAIMLIGIVAAVLRYRLYEVDVIVRRSLLLIVTGAVLAVCFTGLALLLQPMLDTFDAQDDSLAMVFLGGALAVALFPLAIVLRHRLNRLIFGTRDDPYRVVSELRVLGPTSSVEQTLTLALETLARNLRLVYAAVDIDATEPDDQLAVEIGQPHRPPTEIELVSNGHPWGRLRLGVAPGREPFGPRDRRLLDDVASQVGALVESLVMNRALQRSRERIITAREEERRRIRRDLHDGLGPALATQSMKLQVAAELLETDTSRVGPLLRELTAETRSEITEIRRLVDDLRPQILDQLGLVSALRQRAASFTTDNSPAPPGATVLAASSGNSRLHWDVVADDVEPLPAAVEVAAYRIVLEAVNNAAKHAQATSCRVSLVRTHTALDIVVADNGVGLGDHIVPGVGLGSMRERAEELGGTFSLTSDIAAGSTITVRIPISGTETPQEAQ